MSRNLSAVANIETKITLNDVATLNADATKHGFLKKTPGDATKFLDGTNNYDSVKWSEVDKTSSSLADIATKNIEDLSISDNATLNASTSAHGFLSKLPANNINKYLGTDNAFHLLPVEIGIALSDETTSLTTGTEKATFRMPFAMTLIGVRANVNTAPTGSILIVDINEGGSTILSTKLSIDASEKTSVTAATPAVISDAALADDAEITFDIDQIGSTIPGKGLKIWLIGNRV